MEFLTIQRAARRLNVSPIAVRRYITGGYLPALRVRGEWRIRAEMLERFLKPAEPARQPHSPMRDPVGRPLTEDDALWNFVGMAGSPGEPKTDVSSNKHKYLAVAHTPTAVPAPTPDAEPRHAPPTTAPRERPRGEWLSGLVGMFASDEDQPHDVSSNKHRYLADAVASESHAETVTPAPADK